MPENKETQEKDARTICEEDYTPTAFLLISTEMGWEREVLEALKKIDAVKEAYIVYGVYDLIAKVKADTTDKLKEIVTWQVRRLSKVRSTTTMIVTEKTK